MMTNEDVREQFSPLLDDELSPEERLDVEAVLSQDAALLRELDGLKRTDILYRQLPRQAAPDDLEQRVRAAVAPKLFRFPGRPRRRLWPLLSTAAGLAIISGLAFYQLSQTRMASPAMSAVQEEAVMAVPASAELPRLERAMTEADGASAETRQQSDIFLGVEMKAAPESGETDVVRYDAGQENAPSSLTTTMPQTVATPFPPARPAVEAPSSKPDQGMEGLAQRNVAGRKFTRVQDVWIQDGYAGDSPIALKPDSLEWRNLTGAEAELSSVLELEGGVIFQADKRWYQLQR